jgi:hypothetical protein
MHILRCEANPAQYQNHCLRNEFEFHLGGWWQTKIAGWNDVITRSSMNHETMPYLYCINPNASTKWFKSAARSKILHGPRPDGVRNPSCKSHYIFGKHEHGFHNGKLGFTPSHEPFKVMLQ